MTPDNTDAGQSGAEAPPPAADEIADVDRDAETQERAAEFAALVAEAKPILLRDYNDAVCLEGGWPALAVVAPVLLTQVFTLVDGDTVTFTLANARAVYELAGKDDRVMVYRLTDDHTSPVLQASTQVGGATTAQTGDVDAKGAFDPETFDDTLPLAPSSPARALPSLVDGGPVLSMVLAPDEGNGAWTIRMKARRGGHDYFRTVERADAVDDEALAAAAAEFVGEVEQAIAGGKLRADGPTIAEWVKAGYSAGNYPPRGYLSREPAEDLAANERTRQGLVNETAPGPDPNVKCPECKMYGNRHRPSCSRAV